jgi:hypothetical protein
MTTGSGGVYSATLSSSCGLAANTLYRVGLVLGTVSTTFPTFQSFGTASGGLYTQLVLGCRDHPGVLRRRVHLRDEHVTAVVVLVQQHVGLPRLPGVRDLLTSVNHLPSSKSARSIHGMTRQPALPVRPVAAAVLAAAAAVLLAVALSAPLPAQAADWGAVALAAWCGALLAACAALSHRSGAGLAQWKLGCWFLLWCALTSGITTLTPLTGLAAQIGPSSITRAEWLTAVAAAAMAAGYCAVPRRGAVAKGGQFMRRMGTRRPGVIAGPLAPWLLYGAGTTARLAAAVLTGRLGDAGDPATAVVSAAWYQQALADAAYACPLAVAVAGLRAFRQQAPGAKAALAVLLAAECAFSAVSGSKGGIVTAAVAVAISYASAGRRMPARLVLGAVAFFLVIVIPFTAAYRSGIHGGTAAADGQPAVSLSPAQAAAQAPAIAGNALAAASLSTLGASAGYLGQRLQEIDAPAIVVQETPSQIPYTSAAQLPEALAADVIPRALWPGKPIIDPGYQFTVAYYGDDHLTYSAITPQADLWRYGGWVPVIAGMALLGWLMRVLDDVLDIRRYPQAALLVLLLWPMLAAPEGPFTTTLAVLPGLVLTWLVACAAVFRRAPVFTARLAGAAATENLQPTP